jgi:hypothetical protein
MPSALTVTCSVCAQPSLWRWLTSTWPIAVPHYRFVDRDGDGYISAADIFALQAMLMQKSEVFLRVRGAVSSLCDIVCVVAHSEMFSSCCTVPLLSGLCQFAL